MRNKILGYVFLGLVFAAVAAGVYWYEYVSGNKGNNGNNREICIQVVTRARNLQTGEEKDFPTPCDVPDEWEKIERDFIK